MIRRKSSLDARHTQLEQKGNVWAGIIRDRVIGPVFLKGNLNGQTYRSFLPAELIPALTGLFPHHVEPDLHDNRMWLQQDGAPPHYC